ncbi:GHKL domain protein [Leptospira ryugenii]|uniref:histidine kinase n=1 Tax=Leptospira ryugenii TaxID=1917863 RepID=A0A2P2DYN1_9LEPT|nr:GHKL domain protein [Leptospira ryugenii]
MGRKFSIISMFAFVALFACRETPIPKERPTFSEVGVLGLKDRKLEEINPFPLEGIWHAFPGKLAETEEDFLALEKEVPIPLKIPGYWIDQNLPPHGCVTYRLKLDVDLPGNLMIYLKEASSAYRLYAYSKERGLVELGGSGTLSLTKEGSIGYYGESARSFRVFPSSALYLVVSNHLYSRGGPYYSPILGSPELTLVFLRTKERKKFFFLGVFFLLSLYHLVLYLHRRRDMFTLFYAIMCFMWFLRIALFERVTRDWFMPSDFMEMLQIRLEYLTFILLQIFAVNFFYHFFSPHFKPRTRNILIVPLVLILLVTLFSPYSVYTKFLYITQVYMMVLLVTSYRGIYRIIRNRDTRHTGIVFLLGTTVILATTVYDSLVFLYRWELPFLTEFAFTFYSICLAYEIANRNSYAWETAEYLTTNLRNEVDWKTIELRKEKEKAEKASEMKDKFISIVSHDIRSPLFGISSVVNLLTESPPSLSPDKTKQVLNDASIGLKNLLSMVEDLIQYSRFQNATIFPDYQLFDFNLVFESLKEKAKSLLDTKNLRLQMDIPDSAVAIGDPHLIQHLLWNFLTNAIKFSHPGSSIEIRAKEINQHWNLSIIDQGIGFPEDWAERIFEEGFVYVRKGTADEFGAGVGLAFCKEVSDRHGGLLVAHSLEGKGSHFTFMLPNYDRVVLVLDDNPGYRSQVRKILKNLPVVIWEEEYADHALQSIPKLRPDLVIVDFSMPEKDGLTFLTELYANPDMVEIKSLMLSSSQNDPKTGKKLEEDLLKIGGDSFLKKTVSDERLFLEIKRLLGFL